MLAQQGLLFFKFTNATPGTDNFRLQASSGTTSQVEMTPNFVGAVYMDGAYVIKNKKIPQA